MKRNASFCLSIALNIVLLGLVVFGIYRLRSPASAQQTEDVPTTQSVEVTAAAASRPVEAITQPKPGQMVDTLRAAGVSEKIVAEVAAADFESDWKTRWNEVQRKFRRG